MATKTLTLDALLPDQTPAKGTRFAISVDRDVSIKNVGRIAKKGAILDTLTIGQDGAFPTLPGVVPNDDASLQDWSLGYALIIEAEQTPLGGITGSWTVVITSATGDSVRLSDLDQAIPSPIPNAQVSAAQISQAISDSSDALAAASSAQDTADEALATAQTSIAPTNTQIDAHLGGDSTGLVTAVADKVAKGSLVIDVADYGAVGNGSTDDTTAINNALAAAGTARQALVLLDPSKTYAVSNWITPRTGSTMQGGTIKLLASATTGGILINSSGVTVRGVTVDLNKAATTNGGSATGQAGVYITAATGTNVAGVILDHVTVKNGWQRGIYAQAAGTGTINDIRLYYCTVIDAGERAIHIGGSGASTNTGFTVDHCTVINPTSYGIICQGVSDAAVTYCILIAGAASTNNGIVMSATSAQTTHFIVLGCRVYGFNTTGKWGILATWKAQVFQIIGNTVEGCAGGIDVDVEDGSNPGVEVTVSAAILGNTVQGCTNTYGIYARLCNGLAIASNTSSGNTGSSPGDGIGVSSATGIPITGNTTKGNAGHGIGLYGTSSGGGHPVAGNVSTGNTGTNYYSASLPIAALFGTTSTTVPS